MHILDAVFFSLCAHLFVIFFASHDVGCYATSARLHDDACYVGLLQLADSLYVAILMV